MRWPCVIVAMLAGVARADREDGLRLDLDRLESLVASLADTIASQGATIATQSARLAALETRGADEASQTAGCMHLDPRIQSLPDSARRGSGAPPREAREEKEQRRQQRRRRTTSYGANADDDLSELPGVALLADDSTKTMQCVGSFEVFGDFVVHGRVFVHNFTRVYSPPTPAPTLSTSPTLIPTSQPTVLPSVSLAPTASPPLMDRGVDPPHHIDGLLISRLLLECEGDCDSDSDCEGALRCFQRDDSRKIPGCRQGGSLGDHEGWDYCYDIGKAG